MEISTQDNIQPLLQQLPSALFQVSSEAGREDGGRVVGRDGEKEKESSPNGATE